MNSEIANCAVTHSNSKVIREYVDDRKNPLYKKYKGYSSGVELSGTHIYTITSGTVVYVGNERGNYTVTVAYNDDLLISYCLLSKPVVSMNSYVSAGDMIGYSKKSVRVEYLNPSTSIWPVRVGTRTYYKHDPTDFILNGVPSSYNYSTNVIFDPLVERYQATQPFSFQDKQSLDLGY